MNINSSEKNLPPSLQIPKFVKYIAKILRFFSNKLAILYTAKLFVTPFNYSTPNREKAMDESSQKKTLFVPSINKNIHILSYGFSDKKVLLAHGWAGRRTQLFMIANKLLEKGFMVISFDGPSHGKSPGKETNLIEYIETIKEINKEFGSFEAAVGHSFGSMAIMNAQAKKKIFNCIVTVGSGDKVSDILINFSKSLGLDVEFGKKLINHFEKKWKIKLVNYNTNVAAKKIKIPALIVHDAIDGDVNVSCAINIRQNLKHGKLYITNGLGHTKILRDQKTSNKIVDFIIENT
ncbi:alpha/beta hydrolase [uncultured Polaribacter sp.]|uniref:alpha/beta hydrolase family protein n=1 Tax=uncultured Polaribacter sp. TaxID=174711 RepID=UPI0026355F7A|nr:alpha/beta hydrolase [uncultured Polaribacter sp.]